MPKTSLKSESKISRKLNASIQNETVRRWQEHSKLYHRVYDILESHLSEHGCTMPRFRILELLYFSGPKNASQLATELGVTRGNISTFVKRLLKAGGIVVSENSPSKGRPNYELSPFGIAFFEKIYPQHVALIKKLF